MQCNRKWKQIHHSGAPSRWTRNKRKQSTDLLGVSDPLTILTVLKSLINRKDLDNRKIVTAIIIRPLGENSKHSPLSVRPLNYIQDQLGSLALTYKWIDLPLELVNCIQNVSAILSTSRPHPPKQSTLKSSLLKGSFLAGMNWRRQHSWVTLASSMKRPNT